MLWQRVSDIEPGGFGSNKGVFSGANTRIGIERPQCYLAEFSLRRHTEAGTTGSAERPADTRRRFIDGQVVLTRQPTKMLGADLCVG